MPSEPYQPLERIRARVEHEPTDLFEDNAEKRFDRLIMGTEEVGDGDAWTGLEAEARGIIETLSGDNPWNEETDRVDEKKSPDTATLPLAYPIQTVSKVEIKRTLRDDWQELEDYQYQATEHHVVAEFGARAGRARTGSGSREPVNELLQTTTRRNWADESVRVRVTYDRGFDPVPLDIQAVQITMINRMLRMLRNEQTFAAASPDDFAAVSPEFDAVMTDDIRQRIDDATPLGAATRAH